MNSFVWILILSENASCFLIIWDVDFGVERHIFYDIKN